MHPLVALLLMFFSASCPAAEGHEGKVMALAYTPGGRVLLSAGEDGQVRLWEGKTGRNLGRLAGGLGELRALAIDEMGTRVAVAGSHIMRVLWLGTGRRRLQTHGPAKLAALAWSGREELILYATEGVVRRRRARDGQVLAEKKVPPGWVWAAAFSANGYRLALGDEDRRVLQGVDPRTGRVHWESHAHGSSISALAYSPDGTQLASGSYDRMVRLFDAGTGRLIARWEAHDSPVYSLAFTPGGARIVSGSKTDGLALWSLEGEQLGTQPASFVVEALAMAPDGRRVAFAGTGPGVGIWELPTGAGRHSP